MSSLNFDQHQFEGSRAFPVSAATRIAYEDYRSMQTATRAATSAAWVPPFALNDKKLQKVLLVRVWHYVHGGTGSVPETIDRAAINQAATAKATQDYTICETAAPIQRQAKAQHIAAVCKAGGFLQLHAAIAFRSWRLGMDSVEVAASVGMTPQAVRQALWRMRFTAKKLGYDVGRAGHTAGMLRERALSPKTLRLNAEAVEKYKSGMAIPEIAITVFGYAPSSRRGINRVREAVREAGITIPAKPRSRVQIQRRRSIGKKGRVAMARGRHLAAQRRHVAALEKLAAENGGLMPRRKWLTENGYTTSYEFMIAYPDAFARLRSAKAKGKVSLKKAELKKRIVDLYGSGMSVPAIALQLGYRRRCGNNTVRNCLIRAGLYQLKQKPRQNGAAVVDRLQ